MLAYLGFRLSQRLGDEWRFRQRMRGRIAGIEGAVKRHLAGLETLITLEYDCRVGAAQWPSVAAAQLFF